jgi:nucleotide-binding universal stress UspA family protein
MNLTEVLFPTDFSEASGPAGRVASEMARQWGARLHIVHVVPPVTDPGDSAELLKDCAADLGRDLPVETALLSGRVARQIVEYARAKAVGLIVMGTHGRTGVTHALVGSVAEAVVRLAPCLVLTVPVAVFARGAEAARVPAELQRGRQCIVCGGETGELICERCRARIRGEALEQKIEAERPGRRGSAV